ncbi:hypothetical protein AV530_012215 [Patagioenas fasciata monilis]|uniref:Uncharacterized protein n=1 Tax=Patagioenas fasciata monilis TaxID=372326 RepID=A0A1V4K574_PATFA|nr:hypothetical protein AV530_012215 [Patagioenas fasciata monilis]
MSGIVSKDSLLLFESSSVQANRVSPEKQPTPSPTSFSSELEQPAMPSVIQKAILICDRVSTEAKKNLKSEKFGSKKKILPAGFPSYMKWKMKPLLVLLCLAQLKSGLDEVAERRNSSVTEALELQGCLLSGRHHSSAAETQIIHCNSEDAFFPYDCPEDSLLPLAICSCMLVNEKKELFHIELLTNLSSW